MTIQEEIDYRIFTTKSEADKAINSLKGILTGINIDGFVNETEIHELKSWTKKYFQLVNRNPFKEFMIYINDILACRTISIDDIADLLDLCQKYETDSIYYNGITADIQTLQGICYGILSDGEINDKEILELNNWLKSNKHLSSYYPYDELNDVLQCILRDGIIEEEERMILKAYFMQFTRLINENTHTSIESEIAHIPISQIYSKEPSIDFTDKIFCLSGKFQGGNQNDLLNYIIQRGGQSSNGISKKVNYLIVGDNGNEAWAYACYGRKVEQAIKLRKEGHNILIINEFVLWDFLNDKIKI